MAWLSGYVAIVVGMLVTLAVQSSSITTSALTPLVGVGVVKLERMYPTVLGANIGTCITGVLAALAADASKLYLTLQVAYAHLLFNITGILIFYCVWPLRALPINAAKFLGDTTAEYRWFALAYILVAFFLIPIVFLAFSLAGTACFVVMISITLTIALIVVVINVLQRFKPSVLPAKLRTWEFLPKYMRSLEPMDRLVCLPLIANVVKMCPRFAGKMGVEAKDVPVVKVTTSSTCQKPEPVQSSSA
uniref:Sodium-dependent phosphate transport protein 2B n=1 Tax=Prymnesium polylepis TaxID=72548 RepID=A0A7S4ILM7_9EUKA